MSKVQITVDVDILNGVGSAIEDMTEEQTANLFKRIGVLAAEGPSIKEYVVLRRFSVLLRGALLSGGNWAECSICQNVVGRKADFLAADKMLLCNECAIQEGYEAWI